MENDSSQSPELPAFPSRLWGVSDRADLAMLEKKGIVAKISRDEIRDQYSDLPVLQVHDAGAVALPVYVAKLSVLYPDAKHKTGNAQVMRDSTGHSYVLVTEEVHKWTEEYARENYVPSDAAFTSLGVQDDFKKYVNRDAYGRKQQRHRDIDERYDHLTQVIHHMTQDIGSGDVQIKTSGGALVGISANTQEGHKFIVLNEKSLSSLLQSDAGVEQAEAVAGHEVVHTALDMAKSLARRHNNPVEHMAEEQLADELGSGPLGAHYSRGGIRQLTSELRKCVEAYNAEHGTNIPTSIQNLNKEDFERVNIASKEYASDHPPPLYRMVRLGQIDWLMQEFEQTRSVTTLEDRKFEARWIHEQLDSPELKSARGRFIEHYQQAAIDRMEPLLMQELEKNLRPSSASSTPPVAPEGVERKR